jgi:hypothetical protein
LKNLESDLVFWCGVFVVFLEVWFGWFVLVAIPSLTPKAFANFSPGLERCDNPGIANKKQVQTLKGFGNWRTLSGFNAPLIENPGLSKRQPWAEIGERLWRWRRIYIA